MIFSHTAGQNKLRRMVILSHNSTWGIKNTRRRFWNGAQFIEKFLYYIESVGLNESALLNLLLSLGQKDAPTVRVRS
jgi:hypothetical protein